MGSSKLLKVTGIIMIIGGALLTLISISGIALGTFLVAYGVDGDQGTANGILLVAVAIIAIAAAVLELVAGIMGVKNWDKPQKANGCFIIGIVIMAVSVINAIISMSISGFNTNTLVNLGIGLILPALYTYGAAQLKKSAQ